MKIMIKRKNTIGRQVPASGWIGLVAGLGLLWVTTYVILPWGQGLPYVRPIMEAITAADVDAGTYWYTQSEETALAQSYVESAIGQHTNN